MHHQDVLLVVVFVIVLMSCCCTLVSAQEELACFTGFIMDRFCIDQVNMIDNGLPTLKQPEKHSVHCLIEIASCVESGYEILVNVNASEYQRAVALDSVGNEMVIVYAKKVGLCLQCDQGTSGGQQYGLAGTIVGMLDTTYTETPPRLLVTAIYSSNTTCEIARSTLMTTPTPNTPVTMVSASPDVMTTAKPTINSSVSSIAARAFVGMVWVATIGLLWV